MTNNNSDKQEARQGELNVLLRKEVLSDNIDEHKIRSLVLSGANINLITDDESLLMEVIFFLEGDLLKKTIGLLIELGANIGFENEDGITPLGEACISCKSDIVGLLLKKGVNPNVIQDRTETILDSAEFDLYIYENRMIEGRTDKPYEIMESETKKIVEQLKTYGAKNLRNLLADTVGSWLTIFATNPTGLLTNSGHLRIENLPNASVELIDNFNVWLKEHWDSWPNNNVQDKPKEFDRELHNKQGAKLARKIKEILNDAVDVQFLSISHEYEQKGIRSVDHRRVLKNGFIDNFIVNQR